MEGSYSGKGLASLCIDTALRLGLGVMFLYAAWGKILDPGKFQETVENYHMLPSAVTALFAATMSMAELLVGAMFIFSKWTREAAFATAVMLVMFIVALAQAQVRGLDISCGCFSEDEDASKDLLVAIARDVLLFVPTAWLLIKGQRRWIADFRRMWYTVRQ